LAAAIKAKVPGQPVVMITAYAEMLQSSGNPLTGVDFVISKPFLLLWEQNFGGTASFWAPSFSILALTDAAIIAFIIFLTFYSHGRRETREEAIDKSAVAFQTELDIQGGNWHYLTGAAYTDAASLVTTLMQNVSRNGSLLLNLTQHGRGNLDPQCTQIAQDIGAWLKVNGEAVYASRPFETFGDSTVLYTRNGGKVYATVLGWNRGAITLKALATGGATLGHVTQVELLGSTVSMTFVQNGQGLAITPGGTVAALTGISNSQLASGIRVFRITHDKGWINDDDPGASAPGWLRQSNLGTGDFNNDLTTSSTVGSIWSSSFTGTGIDVYAPKQSGAGTLEIQIDGQMNATADLSTTGTRQPQQLVAQVTGLTAGAHTIGIINRGPGTVAIDALVAH